MHSSVSERRSKPRYRLQFPVVISGENPGEEKGITRDVSESGVYFYTDSLLAIGQAVQFRMLMPMQGGTSARAFCQGTVVRVETPNLAAAQTSGVAVHMTSVQLV